ncbi:septum formation initiator family protein [Streptomyces sp. NPDC093591]|uniref:septum formation initiator family protein n=1 Tax=Streptomyces sp. NPDC093591 TaxID=3366044 RepID=UPI0038163ACB
MSRKPELRGRAARLARLFPTGGGQAARAPFVLLVVVLLGGGLIGLLVLNSALSEGAFELDDLKRDTKSLTDEEQSLQRDIDAYSAPDALQRRAQELGMVPGGDPAFLGPDGTVKGFPSPAPADRTGYVPLVLAPEALVSEPTEPPAPTTAAPEVPQYTAPEATSAVPQYAAPEQFVPSAQSSTYPTPGR